MGNLPFLVGLDSHSHILIAIMVRRFLIHVVWESMRLWILSGASIIVYLCNFMLSFVTMMFCGHLGSLELAGASIANVGIQGLAYGLMV